MDWLLVLVLAPFIFLFLICGIQLSRGKWLMLLAGYNTLSVAERKKINGPALGKLGGLVSISCAILLALMAFSPTPLVISLVLILIGGISFGAVYYANTATCFKHN